MLYPLDLFQRFDLSSGSGTNSALLNRVAPTPTVSTFDYFGKPTGDSLQYSMYDQSGIVHRRVNAIRVFCGQTELPPSLQVSIAPVQRSQHQITTGIGLGRIFDLIG